jgi:hypothetical protein
MARASLAVVLFLTACVAFETDKSEQGNKGSATAQAKLRLAALEWYCEAGKHSEQMPCTNYAFLKALRAANSDEEKRKLVADRLKERRTRQRDRAASTAARDSYTAMYKEYCASGPAHPTICEKYSQRAKSVG